jgi:xanthine dehydrogenase accessory factor
MLWAGDAIPVYVHELASLLFAGRHADVVVETSWDGLGTVITEGSWRPLEGEPREIGGHARDRYVYAPIGGMFRTKSQIGDAVRQGEPIAEIDSMTLVAPLDGLLRGLTHDGVPVSVQTKVIEDRSRMAWRLTRWRIRPSTTAPT